MKHSLQSTALALALGTFAASGMALADPGRGDRGHKAKHDRHDRRDDDRRVVWRDGRRYEVRFDDDRDRRYHRQSGHWDNGRRGPPPWAKGRDYRSYGYDRVVYVPAADYRRYNLYSPRDGYRWMRDDSGRYLLVSIATGIIGDILMRGL